jgi:hypothetical protein
MSFPQFLHHSALAMTVSIAASMLSIANARVYEYKFTDIHGAQKVSLKVRRILIRMEVLMSSSLVA